MERRIHILLWLWQRDEIWTLGSEFWGLDEELSDCDDKTKRSRKQKKEPSSDSFYLPII